MERVSTPHRIAGHTPESRGFWVTIYGERWAAANRFGVPSGFGMGVAVQGLDEQWDLAVALDATEGSLGVEHVRGGATQHQLRLLAVSVWRGDR